MRLYYIILHYAVPYYTILYCNGNGNFIYNTILHFTILYYTTLYYTAGSQSFYQGTPKCPCQTVQDPFKINWITCYIATWQQNIKKYVSYSHIKSCFPYPHNMVYSLSVIFGYYKLHAFSQCKIMKNTCFFNCLSFIMKSSGDSHLQLHDPPRGPNPTTVLSCTVLYCTVQTIQCYTLLQGC